MLSKFSADLVVWSAFSLYLRYQCGWGSSKKLQHSCFYV